jgi:hypothetical protein
VWLCACGGGSSPEPAAAPNITSQPVDTTVTAGQGATFTVSAAGTGPLVYQWLRDGAEIPGATAAIYSIPVAVAADDGAGFSVQISSAAPQSVVTSARATLHVNSAASPSAGLGYVLADLALSQTRGPNRTSSWQTKIAVFDPVTGAQVADADLGVSANAPLLPAWATSSNSLDRTTRRMTFNGDAMVFYVAAGKVWKIDLLAGASHAPTQVSALTDACAIGQPAPMSADGSDAWLAVGRLIDGHCSYDFSSSNFVYGYSQTFVRSTMSATSAPKSFNRPAAILDTLDDGTLNRIAVLMLVDNRVVLHTPAMEHIADVSGALAAPPAEFLPMGYDYASMQAAYYRVDGTLRRVRWTSTGATLEPATHTFASNYGTQIQIDNAADIDALYFSDGSQLLKVTGAGSPLLLGTVAGTRINTILTTPDHVVVTQADPSVSAPASVSVFLKSGGQTLHIDNAYTFSVMADHLVYAKTGAGDYKTYVVGFDGSGEKVFAGGSSVVHRSQIADRHLVQSLLVCQPDAADDLGCNRGELVQIDPLTGTSTSQGRIDHAITTRGSLTTGNLLSNAWLTTGVPAIGSFSHMAAADSSGSAKGLIDFYTFTPGQPNSLKRLTALVP